jgi:hypothetical protein
MSRVAWETVWPIRLRGTVTGGPGGVVAMDVGAAVGAEDPHAVTATAAATTTPAA